MAISGITVTSARRTAVDFTSPHHIEPSGVILKLTTDEALYFVEPLSPGLLLLFVVLPLVIGLLVWVFEHLHRSIQSYKEGNTIPFDLMRLYDLAVSFVQRNYTSGIYDMYSLFA